MDSATRLKVLVRLNQSNTPAADEAIDRAIDRAVSCLGKSRDYEELEFGLEVLLNVGHRRSKKSVLAVDDFMRTVEARRLTHVGENGALIEVVSQYRNEYRLICKGIEVLTALRYLETPVVVESLLWAAVHDDELVRKTSISALGDLARFNISVYFGDESGRGIGATPQLLSIDALEKKDDSELHRCRQGILTLLQGLLSTSMESARWSSDAVTISRAVAPADAGVVQVRQRSIALLKRLFALAQTLSEKLSVVRSLTSATRSERGGSNEIAYAEMISRNAQEVLAFFASVAQSAELQVVQKIEHDSYWIHYHTPSESVAAGALKVKAIIDSNAEYGIYKTLIGFEGVFGDWSRSKTGEALAITSHDHRIKEALVIASHIPQEGFETWQRRILVFAKTESDDMAAFPVFYEFLGEVARSYPQFALDLLKGHADQLSRFLIPLLRGLWDGEKREDLRIIMQGWLAQAHPKETSFMYACAKLFLSTRHVDFGMLRQVLSKAVELKDASVMRQVASVAIARSAAVEPRDALKELLLTTLSHLTALGDADWVREIWYRKEKDNLVADLLPAELRDVLANLRYLRQIDYQAEDVLAAMAQRFPDEVVDFLIARLDRHAEQVHQRGRGDYEDLPFQFHSLQEPLSSNPEMVVGKVLNLYLKDSTLFVYRGAKLLQLIFPQFPEGFQQTLMRQIREGGDADLKFVANVLRAYSGERFIQPVAKALIERLPPGGEIANEVAIALLSTGVVSGEYGMAEAYEQKRLEVLDWLVDPNERVRTFAGKYISQLEAMGEEERARANESIALRKFRFGEE